VNFVLIPMQTLLLLAVGLVVGAAVALAWVRVFCRTPKQAVTEANIECPGCGVVVLRCPECGVERGWWRVLDLRVRVVKPQGDSCHACKVALNRDEQ